MSRAVSTLALSHRDRSVQPSIIFSGCSLHSPSSLKTQITEHGRLVLVVTLLEVIVEAVAFWNEGKLSLPAEHESRLNRLEALDVSL